jgi:hypothetical protein
MVRARRDELVDEVALGAHDLDAVVAARCASARSARRRDRAPTPQRVSARGLNGVIGERSADGATDSG